MQFNINGQIFELSETSVDFLKKYLQRIRKYIDKNNLESDLYQDIQERIAEKFSELSQPMSNKAVIDIVNEIGEPDEIFNDLLMDWSNNSHKKNSLYNWEKIKEFFSEQTTKKLTLSQSDCMIGWVCWGIAQRLWIDALWIRLIFLVWLFFFGITFVIYIALWILLPNENKQARINTVQKTSNLSLSSQDKMIAGVCWGIAERFWVDSLWIRLGFIIWAFFFGVTFVIYIALWILLPKKNDYINSQIVEKSKNNLEEVKQKSTGFFHKFFLFIKNIMKFIFKIIIIWCKIFITALALFIIFACIAPILFLLWVFFTDFDIYNQILFENIHPYLVFGWSAFLFMLLIFILGLIWKIFHGKIIANFLMIIGFLGSFVAIFITGLWFFSSAANYTNIYTFTQKIDLESYNQQEINIDVFWDTYEQNWLRVNWLDFVEFRQTSQQNPYIDIQSVINYSDEQNAQKYFQNLKEFSYNQSGNEIFIGVDSVFKQKTTYQFLRRNIIIYIPEWQNVKLWEISPYGNLKNRIYVDNDSYYYWLSSCENTTISYITEQQSFTCK